MDALQEIGILKSISYDKNIVQFYGASMVNREPMLLLEFCEGGDLRSVRQAPNDLAMMLGACCTCLSRMY